MKVKATKYTIRGEKSGEFELSDLVSELVPGEDVGVRGVVSGTNKIWMAIAIAELMEQKRDDSIVDFYFTYGIDDVREILRESKPHNISVIRVMAPIIGKLYYDVMRKPLYSRTGDVIYITDENKWSKLDLYRPIKFRVYVNYGLPDDFRKSKRMQELWEKEENERNRKYKQSISQIKLPTFKLSE